MRAAVLGFLVVATVPLGCGGSPRAMTRQAAPDLVPLPRAAVRPCAALAATRRVPVRCPTKLPDAGWTVRYRSLVDGPAAYLVDYETGGGSHRAAVAFHVLAGGRLPAFDLSVTRAGTWPVKANRPSTTCCNTRPTDLGLVGARHGRHRGFWYPSGFGHSAARRSPTIRRSSSRRPGSRTVGSTEGTWSSSGTRTGRATCCRCTSRSPRA